MAPSIRAEIIEDGILLITIDRPKANAIDAATSRSLSDAFAEMESRDDVRVCILTGAGSRFFSAGWDLKADEPHDADHGHGGFAGLTRRRQLAKPVIAAVNGAAYGGGAELALAATLIVASEDAAFAFPEATLGILPDAGGLHRLAARIPRVVALELLLTGREMGAEEALDRGLVNRVVAADQVLPEAKALARQIVRSAPLAVAAILQATSAAQGATDDEGFKRIAAQLPEVAAIVHTEDAVEGLRAFSERREPAWRCR